MDRRVLFGRSLVASVGVLDLKTGASGLAGEVQSRARSPELSHAGPAGVVVRAVGTPIAPESSNEGTPPEATASPLGERSKTPSEPCGGRALNPPPMTIDLPRVGPLHVLVLGPKGVASHALSIPARMSVGRSPSADIFIDDPSISRMHAALRTESGVDGAGLVWIQDLGSSNGTHIAGKRLLPGEQRAISNGDPVELGHSTLLIRRGPVNPRVRSLRVHGDFEVRLEEECLRAAAHGLSFAVLRLGLLGQARTRDGQDLEGALGAVEAALGALLGPEDLVARCAPGVYEVLLANTDAERAQQAVEGLRFALNRVGADVRVGTALYPLDAQAAEALLKLAGERIRGPSSGLSGRSGECVIVVEDPRMRAIFELVARVAPSDISVLILGETGTGKEVIARALHRRSGRAAGPFLAVNCGALPEALLESELFGYERGAFTGALRTKLGLLEAANQGTVFLDEVGEMPQAIQVKLLRVLEDRAVRRVGGLEPRTLNVRFVAATNRDLGHSVKQGQFREDLFYRLNGISIVVPPLRDRPSEIPLLAQGFAADFQRREGFEGTATISAEALDRLVGYAWPGNVRELRNGMERAVILAGGRPIGLEHLPMGELPMPEAEEPSRGLDGRGEEPPRSVEAFAVGPERVRGKTGAGSLSDEVEELERRRIVAALAASGGNQTRAASQLGMSRKKLINRLNRYGIARPRKRDR